MYAHEVVGLVLVLHELLDLLRYHGALEEVDLAILQHVRIPIFDEGQVLQVESCTSSDP